MTCPEVEELIDLFVIGALSQQEGREVAAHLDGCPGCRAIEERVREVAQLLRLAVDEVDPSPALRSRLFALVRQDASPVPVGAPSSASPPWWRTVWGWLSPAPMRTAAALAVIPLVVSVWLAFQVVQLRSEVQSTETALATSWQTSQTAADIMGRAMEHGGAMASLPGQEKAPQAAGMLYYAPSEGDAVLVVRGLPELSRGQVYQCWLISGERRMNGGTFYRENDGRAMLVIKSPMPLDAVDAVGVTEEPHGGSMEPRGDRYVWGRLRRT
jgi:Anti-sigma-K factor rskA/Putative zinc-finger